MAIVAPAVRYVAPYMWAIAPSYALTPVFSSTFALTFRRLPESTSKFWIVAVATCTVVLLVPAGLLALFANDYGGVGPMLLIPTYFQVFGIPLIISVPFAALGAQKVAKTFSDNGNAGS